jgi:hypothetical protein
MMARERPALAELRARVHKDRHREIGNWLARKVGRPSAVYGTWLAVRLGVSAHQVTVAAILVSACSALAIASGTRAGFVAGVTLAHLAFWLDHVDGQVARWRGTASLDGVYLDYLMHHAIALMQGFALGYGLAMRTGDLRWCAAGFAVGFGWLFLGLHNDSRYKATFQRLKRETRSFRVDGGSGGRPEPPARWPRRGLGSLTWPAYKVCEPHAILIGLTVLATTALIAPHAWLTLWKLEILAMASLAPMLAIGRSARTIARGGVETEFGRWFAAMPPEEPGDLVTTESGDLKNV